MGCKGLHVYELGRAKLDEIGALTGAENVFLSLINHVYGQRIL